MRTYPVNIVAENLIKEYGIVVHTRLMVGNPHDDIARVSKYGQHWLEKLAQIYW